MMEWMDDWVPGIVTERRNENYSRAKLPRLTTSQLCLRARSRLPDPMTVAEF